MTDTFGNHDRFWGLVDTRCLRRLTDPELVELESCLTANVALQQAYLEFCQLHTELYLTINAHQALANIRTLIDTSTAQATSKTTVPLRHVTSGLFKWTLSSMALTTLAVAMVFYGSFALVVWTMSWGRDRSLLFPFGGRQVAQVHKPVAYLVKLSTDDHPSSALQATERVSIDSGVAKIEFVDGAIVLLEGPTNFTLESANRGYLHQGKLTAQVPKQAIGFTIQTDTATVVDLGTEFNVEVSSSGATEVQVTKGKVELYSEAKRGSDLSVAQAVQPITITAGSAVRVDPAQPGAVPVVRKVVATPNRLDAPSGPEKSGLIRVHGALASSEFPSWEAKYLIDGSGMHGDRHDDVVPYTMWMTQYGKVKNEFVLFDLGRPYHLESIKVWNINDSRDRLHISRGVKQANVYVSTSNKGNPLTNPDDWKLVAENHEFTIAPGTADYATPDVVPLGGVVARFAAIVILDHLGPDPRGNPPSDFCVGLSEVQFFGSRKGPEARR